MATIKPNPTYIRKGADVHIGVWGATGNACGFWSDKESVAEFTEEPLLKGKDEGETTIHVGGAAEKVSWGEAKVHVLKTWHACAKAYNADVKPAIVNSSKSKFKFVFISDPQGGPGDIINEKTVNHKYATWFAEYMAKNEKPDFILVGGDLANYGDDAALWIDDMVKGLGSQVGVIPIYCAIGNHDLVDNALGYYKKSQQDGWLKIWQDHYFKKGGQTWPTTGPKDMGNKGLAYAFAYGNTLFIVVDSYYLYGEKQQEGLSRTLTGMLEEIDVQQLAWVDYLMDWAEDQPNIKHTFIISHAPLFTEDHPNNDELFCMLNSKPKFSALLAGHRHKLKLKSMRLPIGLPPPVSGTPCWQIIDGTGAGGESDHVYVRIEIDDGQVTVTPVHKTATDTIATEPSVTWTGPRKIGHDLPPTPRK